MDIQTLTSFFMWCSIINGGILVVWSLTAVLATDWAYRTQKWFPIPRDKFNVMFYLFIGIFKTVFLVFNLVPYLALLIIT